MELRGFIVNPTNIRPPSKLACAQGCEGDTSPRTAAYSNVHEDSSTTAVES